MILIKRANATLGPHVKKNLYWIDPNMKFRNARTVKTKNKSTISNPNTIDFLSKHRYTGDVLSPIIEPLISELNF